MKPERLINEIRAEARKQDGLASGFRMAGDRDAARRHHAAARALEIAAAELERLSC